MGNNRKPEGVIFDMDGVITRTARVHARAWKMLFDEYLRSRHKRFGEPFREFTSDYDYLTFVDGKPRYEGVKSFLSSRGIEIPYGTKEDPPEAETVCGLGNRKNHYFLKILEKEGVEVYESTVRLIKELKKEKIAVGAVSSSKNCRYVLKAARVEDLFDTIVDGVVSEKIGLKGKPEGDIFVQAAANLGVSCGCSVVVEDALSGVMAGRNGEFGLVVGVARSNNHMELANNGADVVVTDLSEISVEWMQEWFLRKPVYLFDNWEKRDTDVFFEKGKSEGKTFSPRYFSTGRDIFCGDKPVILFLDYDGTLTPIVSRPELAVMSEDMRDLLRQLSKKVTVSVVSGRLRSDVESLVGIKGIFYAGSHGFDISGPDVSMVYPPAEKTIPLIDEITQILKKELGSIEGVIVEEKRFSVAVHYRLVDEKDLPRIKEVVDRVMDGRGNLRLMMGKKVYEILPDINWDKGKAIRWIMEALGFEWDKVSVVYIGDDVTDEDAFRAVRTRGSGVLVAQQRRASAADFYVCSPEEVREIFKRILGCLRK